MQTATDLSILLQVRELSCVRSDRELFSGLSFSVSSGEIVVVEGRNGSGKTSLLRLLTGLSEPEQGEILWRDKSIFKEREDYLRELFYFGHLPAVKGELTAGENLALSGKLMQSNPADVEKALVEVGLKGFEDMPTHFLSAGQKRRVGLARLFCTQAKFWILDEPLTALDVHGVKKIEQTIGAHAGRGGAVVMTTHQAIAIPGVNIKTISLGRPLKQVAGA